MSLTNHERDSMEKQTEDDTIKHEAQSTADSTVLSTDGGDNVVLRNRVGILEAKVLELTSEIRELTASKVNEEGTNETALAGKTGLPEDPVVKSELPEEGSVANSLAGKIKVKYETWEESPGGIYQARDGIPPVEESGTTNHAASEYAFVFAPYVRIGGQRDHTRIIIQSEALATLIRSTIQPLLDHENVKIWQNLPVTVRTNNVLIWHCWQKLLEASTLETHPESGREELRVFLRHVELCETTTLRAREEASGEGRIQYEKVWILFPPGTCVVAFPFEGCPQLFNVHRHHPSGDKFCVSCWGYDWNGTSLVRVNHEFQIPKFSGSMSISELPCYPLGSYNVNNENSDDLLTRLTKRGIRYKEFSVPSANSRNLYTCTKSLVSHERSLSLYGHDGLFSIDTLTSKENVIIDPTMYQRFAPSSNLLLGRSIPISRNPCECQLCGLEGLRKKWAESFKPDEMVVPIPEESRLSPNFYAQLPPRLLGYLTDRKKWGQFDVDSVTLLEKEVGESWDELLLDPDHRDNIKSIIDNHFKRLDLLANDPSTHGNTVVKDVIKGKGNGLVILLHGVAGVGKTMTAEALAQLQQRRLLRIDAADMDYQNTGQVSATLKTFFELAHAWGTILLLDEADVFLQLRKRQELAQNALVSVLLRELEYFKGVLIMTTNRIQTIDFAVQSRINYAVRFTAFNAKSLQKVSSIFMKQLNDNNSTEKERERIQSYLDTVTETWPNVKFTGRDIRNLFVTAQLLDFPLITTESLRKVASATTQFRTHMKNADRAEAQAADTIEE
ncbi:P-loop containing nucleoside triphosphate hydrolase protein [Annulohypoxylon nitens]|nr:P-loop containing nucleoside triphosphate hydrolase protein [Annulohypoxylon nitens]